MPPPPTSELFPALFSVLRSRLTAQASLSDSSTTSVHPGPLAAPSRCVFSCPSDTLGASLSASDPSVNQSILQEIRVDACNKLQVLRRKRLGVMKTREGNQRQLQRMDALATAECDAALQEVTAHDHKFQFFITETETKAKDRLQTLFFECIAEMKKALVRMESVAADTTEESESMVEELRRRNDWQFFLTRLQQECGGDVETSLLVPVPLPDTGSAGSEAAVKGILQKVLEEHGPAMEKGELLVVQSASALRRTTPTRRAAEKNSRSTASLHFGSSAAEMWTEISGHMMRPPKPTKPRQSTSSSARRIRSSIVSSQSTFRQLASANTMQFPGTACDIPLSSAYIRWMIPRRTISQDTCSNADRSDGWRYEELADSNIYFDIAEYEQNFAAVMQNYATSAAMDATSMPFPSDHAVLASARRSLREMSAIFERSREQKETLCADTIFACRHDATNSMIPNQTDCRGMFARASILQLVQTIYYSKYFLELLPPVDVDILRKLYPTSLFGEGCLSTLYVPVVSAPGEQRVHQEENNTAPSEVCMSPLDDNIIHELLLLYVARGKRALTRDVGSTEQLTSLVLSDAVNTLVPHGQPGARFCVIRNPRGLWENDKETGGSSISKEFQCFRNADVLFVECSVSPLFKLRASARQSTVSQDTKRHAVLKMLGTSCMWRSCISSHDYHERPNCPTLCVWHRSVQRVLEVDESIQYVPNENRMRETFFTAESDSLTERIKRVIQTPSSLLEELSSRRLSHSIKAFYEHVVNAASNRTYQTDFLEMAVVGEISNGSTSMRDLEQSHNELRRVVDVSEEILGTEHGVTKELRQLQPMYPDIQHGFYDLEELQTDIRTRDFDLLLCLSQHKLQILKRRRKARRLAPSTSLPSSISFQATELNEGSASVYDVIHVMRKGRQSLLREQRLQVQGDRVRNGSKRNAGLERCASDLAYRVNPYEEKVAPAVKYRASNGRRILHKNSNRDRKQHLI